MSPHWEILEKCEVSVLEADSSIFSGPIDTQGKIEKKRETTSMIVYGHCQALPTPTIVQRHVVFEHRDCIKTFSPGESLATQGFVQEPFRIPTTCA